jgi:hypothetical protein
VFILENSVLKKHVLLVKNMILRAKRWRKVTADVFKCKGLFREYTIYFIADGKKPIAWVYLYRRRGWQASEIHQVYVEPDFRQMGLAYLLYTTAIHDGVLLSSGPSHTTASMAVWSKLARDPAFTVWAHDFYNLERTAEVSVRGNRILSRLQIYSVSEDEDIRLLAIPNDARN